VRCGVDVGFGFGLDAFFFAADVRWLRRSGVVRWVARRAGVGVVVTGAGVDCTGVRVVVVGAAVVACFGAGLGLDADGAGSGRTPLDDAPGAASGPEGDWATAGVATASHNAAPIATQPKCGLAPISDQPDLLVEADRTLGQPVTQPFAHPNGWAGGGVYAVERRAEPEAGGGPPSDPP
jgi:hypothetical protein